MTKILLSLLLCAAALPAAAGETGCVYDMKGKVEVRAAGAAGWAPALKGAPFAAGAAVRTAPDAWCELLFKDGTFVKLDGGSEAGAEELQAAAGERRFSFSFLKGKALWMAAKVKGKAASVFQVRTPSAVCAVRGTDFSLLVSTAGAATVGLFEGLVDMTAGGTTKPLLAGGEARAEPAGALTVESRLSSLMKAEERRYARVKGRVEALRKRLAEREDYIDDYMGRQDKKLSGLEERQSEKLRGRKK